jgi:hypothetical protein
MLILIIHYHAIITIIILFPFSLHSFCIYLYSLWTKVLLLPDLGGPGGCSDMRCENWFPSESLGDPPGESYGEMMGEVPGDPEEAELSLKDPEMEDIDEARPWCICLFIVN